MYKMLFYLMLFFSILMSVTTKNWMIMWFFMELNMISFIPLISTKNNIKFNIKFSLKYFFIQCMGSFLFLFSNLMMMMNNNIYTFKIINFILLISIFIKLGMFPFHSWYIKLMENIDWMNCFILSTFQKIIPLILLMNFLDKNLKLFFLMNILNTIISIFMSPNQNFLKNIMAFSSLNHLSWMTLILMTFHKLFFIYLFIYILINYKLIYMFNYLNLNTLNDIYNLNNSKFKFLIFLLMFSLSGIPPFFGFLLKWMSMYIMKISFLLNFNLMLLMITSAMMTYLYLKFIIPNLLIYSIKNKILLKYKFFMKSFIYFMLYLSFWMLLLFNLI